jgi:helicase SWR1
MASHVPCLVCCQRGIWGPHLIVVPTSCIVNWESEFKRFCPGFKILTYYGSAVVRLVILIR